MYDKYETLCGITEEELHRIFAGPICEMAAVEGCTEEEMRQQLKQRYDGYHFGKRMMDIYNPFSVLNAFDSHDIRDYWFSLGTPTYLIRLMNHFNEGIDKLTGKYYSLDEFVNYKADTEYPLPMIYQSGYLTIKDYDRDIDMFLLDFPNNEVKSGFLTMVAANYFQNNESADSWTKRTVVALKRGETEKFRTLLTSFLASIPYTARRKENECEKERYFQYTSLPVASPDERVYGAFGDGTERRKGGLRGRDSEICLYLRVQAGRHGCAGLTADTGERVCPPVPERQPPGASDRGELLVGNRHGGRLGMCRFYTLII